MTKDEVLFGYRQALFSEAARTSVAQEAGDLEAAEDPAQLAFELNAALVAANTASRSKATGSPSTAPGRQSSNASHPASRTIVHVPSPIKCSHRAAIV